MKRVISIALVVLFVAALLVGCGGSSDPVGSYKIKSVGGKAIKDMINDELEGSGMSVDDYLKMVNIDSLEDMITLELKSDGTAAFTISGTAETGTWKQEGDKLTITIDGDAQEAKLSGSELTFKVDNQEYVFTKK